MAGKTAIKSRQTQFENHTAERHAVLAEADLDGQSARDHKNPSGQQDLALLSRTTHRPMRNSRLFFKVPGLGVCLLPINN